MTRSRIWWFHGILNIDSKTICISSIPSDSLVLSFPRDGSIKNHVLLSCIFLVVFSPGALYLSVFVRILYMRAGGRNLRLIFFCFQSWVQCLEAEDTQSTSNEWTRCVHCLLVIFPHVSVLGMVLLTNVNLIVEIRFSCLLPLVASALRGLRVVTRNHSAALYLTGCFHGNWCLK